MMARAVLGLLGVCLLVSHTTVRAEDACVQDGMKKAFPTLKEMSLKNSDVTIFYADALSIVLTAPHPEAKEADEQGIGLDRPLRTQLLGAGKGYFTVDCNSGMSADPNCTVFQETREGLKEVFGSGGLRFAFPGNGSIYVDGHTNTMFNLRKKYEWKAGKFIEVKQPFNYVGLESKTTENISIYSDKGMKDVVATLPKGSSVTVLINDGDYYLLKTPFGLVGWFRSDRYSVPIEGIFIAGD